MIKIIALLITLSQAIEGSKVIFCYVQHSSVYRPAEGKFQMEKIDPFLCTHVIFLHSTINETLMIDSFDSWGDSRTGMNNLGKLVKLKKKNPDIKILSGLGGWGTDSKRFSDVAKSDEARKKFIDSLMFFLRKHKMDGIELIWITPGDRGGDPEEDRDNFPILLKAIRQEFDKEGKTLVVKLLGKRYAAGGYDLPLISEAVHYVTVKTYEYHGVWEDKVGIYAPLKSEDEDDVESSIDFLLEEGIAETKLVLGLSAGGNAYVMDSGTNKKFIGAKTDGSFRGAWVGQEGILGFNELCWELTKSRLWRQGWHDLSSTPWAVHGRQFVSFEDEESMNKKMEMIKTKNLAGASIDSLDTDDFDGHCYQKKYPLTTNIRDTINPVNIQTNEPTTKKPGTASPDPGFVIEGQVVGNSDW